MRISQRNDSWGFTLVELMVAILITVVGLLGLLQAVNLAMEHNLRNQLRDEAIYIAEDWMANLKVRPFDQISTTFNPRPVPSNLRGGNFSYTLTRQGTDVSSVKQLEVKLEWVYKGATYSHVVRSIRSQ